MSAERTGAAVMVIDDRGVVSWWSGRAPAVPGVDLRVGPGITGRIDPAAPQRLLSWAVDAGAPPGPLGAALADPELADLVELLRERGEAAYSLDCPGLTGPWRERARIAAVARWTMRPIDHGALLIDEAVAEHAAGGVTAAGRLFRHAEYAFAQFGERCREGELSASALELLRLAAPAAAAHGLNDAAAELRAALDGAEIIDTVALLDAVRRWSTDTDAPGAVSVAATLGGDIPPADIDQVPLDPTVLPPRIISWHGAHIPELRVEHHRDTDTFQLSAHLVHGVDPLCREVVDLLAYAADRETGALLAATATTVNDRLVVAELPAAGKFLGAVHFGLFAADIPPAALRRDPIGRLLVDADRAMIDAWNQHRTAMVTLASVPASASEADLEEARLRGEEHLLLAESAALDAQRVVTGLLAELGTSDGLAPTGMLTARLAAIADYLDILRRPEVAADPLTLTELTPPDGESDR
ncbi:hypothetical protein [Nocardia shimofusensis]|uniref:hypothetical protein n=1 Tax=Nocardia shimofusensis TaxID=228596 RepID=UPI0008319E30|nr:hypothetical protein [Nocardia shimofusensis]